jgi:glycosyltransferase involved in cell wall biosynthesis
VLRSRDRAATGGDEFIGTVAFGAGLVAAAGLNFLFSSLMGRMLPSGAFGTLGALIAALLALIGPVNALSGGTEMFAALHDRFPTGRKRLVLPGVGLAVWAVTMGFHSAPVRSAGWFALGGSFLVLLAWNRGALVGLGRFAFVGWSFAVEGVARVALPVLLVALGLGLEGASAGLVLGMLVGLAITERAIPRHGNRTRQSLGADVWIALVGLFALGLTQIVDVFAIRLREPGLAGAYVGAASLARIALFSQMPAAAYALRRAALEGARQALRRTLVLALAPGALALILLQGAPRLMLRVAYGSRFVQSTGTLRILSVAMLLGGFATVGAQLLMGQRSTGWVWSVVPVSAIGTAAIVTMAHAPTSVAVFSLGIQGLALLAVAVPLASILRAQRSPVRGLLILNWRDTRHPQGGGSEVYVEQLARRLSQAGWTVTIFCAAHANAPAVEVVEGVRFIRRGTWRTVYGWGFLYHALGRFGPHEAVIDVKNGIPFFAPLYCRRTVLCLVHHVHRDQWRMNFSARQARLGWWIESRLSVRLYRRVPHVTVSEASRTEVAALGIEPSSTHVIHNGGALDGLVSDVDGQRRNAGRAAAPTIAFLGRLVPHKRVELLFRAAAAIRRDVPDLRVVVIGQGPWEFKLREEADRLGIRDAVRFTGWVDEPTKVSLLRQAWALVLPSVMEGWGLVVLEAAACRTPTIAFRVGGLEESIVHGRTGLLAEDPGELEAAVRSVLADPDLRDRLGAAAAEHAAGFSWDMASMRLQALIERLVTGSDVIVLPEVVPAVTDS